MNIIELRNKTMVARTLKDIAADAEFNTSPLRKYIDQQIQLAADNGEGKVALNFSYVKERVLEKKYGGPTMAAALRHYQSEGFVVFPEHANIVISWL